MARCRRCNKFLLFSTKSGYCANCDILIANENAEKARKAREEAEKRLRDEEEKRRAEEERRIRVEEARKAEEELQRKAEETRKADEERQRKAKEARKAEEERLKKAEEARLAEEEFLRKAEADHSRQEKEAANEILSSKSKSISEKDLLEKSKPIVEQYYHKKINQNEVLKLLKEGSVSVNGFWEAAGEKTCLLSIAVKNEDRELIDYLLNNGCDVNTETYVTVEKYGMRISDRPITTAISGHALDIADQLIKYGADIRLPNQMGHAKVHIISMVSGMGDSETLEWLIKHGISPNTESDSYGGFKTVPIYDAVISGKHENVRTLLRAGANPDYIIRADTADYTSLNWTIMNDDMTSFNLLMDAHADPNCRRISHQGGGDNPALCDAISEGRTEMAERLIRAGADVNCAITINGRRISAMQCAMYNGDFRIINLLQSHGAR